MSARVNHASLYAHDPKRAAERLAEIVGGRATPFHAVKGGWFCFLSERDHWDAPLIELYPRDVTLVRGKIFEPISPPARGAGGHVNITVPIPREELERRCDALGVTRSWRAWQSLLEVWLEDDLLIEIASE